jgi:hypothetical protein
MMTLLNLSHCSRKAGTQREISLAVNLTTEEAWSNEIPSALAAELVEASLKSGDAPVVVEEGRCCSWRIVTTYIISIKARSLREWTNLTFPAFPPVLDLEVYEGHSYLCSSTIL